MKRNFEAICCNAFWVLLILLLANSHVVASALELEAPTLITTSVDAAVYEDEKYSWYPVEGADGYKLVYGYTSYLSGKTPQMCGYDGIEGVWYEEEDRTYILLRTDIPGKAYLDVYAYWIDDNDNYVFSDASRIDITVTGDCMHMHKYGTTHFPGEFFELDSAKGQEYLNKWTGEKPGRKYTYVDACQHYYQEDTEIHVCYVCDNPVGLVISSPVYGEHEYTDGICPCGAVTDELTLVVDKTEINIHDSAIFELYGATEDTAKIYIEYNSTNGGINTYEMTKMGDVFVYTHEDFANSGEKYVWAETPNGAKSNIVLINVKAPNAKLDTPIGQDVTAFEGDEVVISWNAVTNATYYAAYLYQGEEELENLTERINGTGLNYKFDKAGNYTVQVQALAEGYDTSAIGVIRVNVVKKTTQEPDPTKTPTPEVTNTPVPEATTTSPLETPEPEATAEPTISPCPEETEMPELPPEEPIPCLHSNIGYEYVSTISVVNNDDGHTHLHTYYAWMYCEDCGIYFGDGTDVISINEEHRMNYSTSKYVKDESTHQKVKIYKCSCGFEYSKKTGQPEKHKIEKKTIDIKYDPYDAYSHSVYKEYREVCSVCEYKSEIDFELYTEEHESKNEGTQDATVRALVVSAPRSGVGDFNPAALINGFDADADEMYDFLIKQDIVEEINITKITDCTKDKLINGMRETFADACENDTSIIYIAAHGDNVDTNDDGKENESAIILETWGDENTYKVKYLFQDELLRYVKSYVKGKVIIIIGSCHSEGFVEEFKEDEEMDRFVIVAAAEIDDTSKYDIYYNYFSDTLRGVLTEQSENNFSEMMDSLNYNMRLRMENNGIKENKMFESVGWIPDPENMKIFDELNVCEKCGEYYK